MIRLKLYSTGAGESDASFNSLHLCVMGKAADLSDIDRCMILIA